MKSTKVKIRREDGLHLRPAAQIVHLAHSFQSSVCLKVKERTADARNIMSILMLCATMGTIIEVEAVGSDETEATAAICEALASDPNEPLIDKNV